jgi:hypothetical protein
MNLKQLFLAAMLSGLWMATDIVAANLVTNPSFENNQASFVNFPGYISGNTTIDSWTENAANRVGINGNSGSGYPFADNGTIPDGVAVGFIQSNGAASTLSQSISGLSIGTTYKITARINARSGVNLPNIGVSMGATPLLFNQNVTAVGGGNPYHELTFYHQATATSETLEFLNQTGVDTTLVVDQVSVDPVFTTGWSASSWSNDASSGISGASPYTHAYNLGSGANPLINGVQFTGVGGANPSVAGRFAVAGMPSVFTGFVNNVTDPGSNSLASDFVYGGVPGSITIDGLKPGNQYQATFYGASFGGGGGRAANFFVNGDAITVDENTLPNGDGVKLQYTYTADNSGSVTLNVSPYFVNSTIHFHGFANAALSTTAIAGLYNTGVDAGGTPLADDAVDPHWSIFAGPVTGNGIVATSAGGFPIGPWIGDNATSAWVTPANNTEGPDGAYTYRTTFNIDGAGAALRLQGLVATDNSLQGIYLNGNLIGTVSGVDFDSFSTFDVSGFSNSGLNTLDFVVINDTPPGPTGLRVEFTSAIVEVPEPSSLGLLAIGIAALFRLRRQVRGLSQAH